MSDDFYEFVSNVWERKPAILILFAGGFAVFVLLVIGTYRHRRKTKKNRPLCKRH